MTAAPAPDPSARLADSLALPAGTTPATFTQRALAALADNGLLAVVGSLVRLAVLVPVMTDWVEAARSMAWIDDPSVPIDLSPLLAPSVRLAAWTVLTGVAFNLIYFVIGESHRGRTVGKRALSVRVVTAATGATPSPWRVLVRTLAKYLSLVPLGAGYLWMLRSPRRQCWHDVIAGTLVVVEPATDPEPPSTRWPRRAPPRR